VLVALVVLVQLTVRIQHFPQSLQQVAVVLVIHRKTVKQAVLAAAAETTFQGLQGLAVQAHQIKVMQVVRIVAATLTIAAVVVVLVQ
jgi:hypothetical protein